MKDSEKLFTSDLIRPLLYGLGSDETERVMGQVRVLEESLRAFQDGVLELREFIRSHTPGLALTPDVSTLDALKDLLREVSELRRKVRLLEAVWSGDANYLTRLERVRLILRLLGSLLR